MEQIVTDNDTVPYLPQDIIINILKQLPVKSLMRFQCVCKDWKNLFKTPSFIAEHLHHSTKQISLLFNCSTTGGDLCLINRNMQVLEFQKPSFSDPFMGSYRIVDSSNGLLCIELFESKSIFLWNPATREVRQVPKALKLLEEEYCQTGFGFSKVVNDYKIVRLFSSWYDSIVHRVEVYSLSTGSWKEVDVGNLKGVIEITNNGVTCNGAVFWFGLKEGVEGESDRCLIVSFDITMEVFTLIEIPPTLSPKSSRCNKLTVYENKLAILSQRGYGKSDSSLMELWVMEGLSWAKIHTITSCPSFLQPKAVWQNKIIFKVSDTWRRFSETEGGFVVDKNIKTIIVNLTTDEFKISAFSQCNIDDSIMSYAESLVPVGNNFV